MGETVEHDTKKGCLHLDEGSQFVGENSRLLSSDRWRVTHQEISWSPSCVIRIGVRRYSAARSTACGWPLCRGCVWNFSAIGMPGFSGQQAF